MPDFQPPTPVIIVKAPRDWLVTLTCISVLLTTSGLAIHTVIDTARTWALASASRGRGTMLMKSWANVDATHVVLTNTDMLTFSSCVKGRVENDESHAVVDSLVVCSGDVKPRSSVELTAPFAVGAIAKLCPGEAFGGTRTVDWAKCTFDVVDMDLETSRAPAAKKP